MKNVDLKPQHPSVLSRLNCHKSLSIRDAKEQENQRQSEKEPSSLISIILVLATISLYALGIHQISVTSASIIQSMIEEVHQDRGLRGF